MRISDWSSDVCSSDLGAHDMRRPPGLQTFAGRLHLQKLPTLEFQALPARTAASPLGLIRVKACAAPAPYLGAHARQPHLRRRPAGPLRPAGAALHLLPDCPAVRGRLRRGTARSEEHTSELQSLMRISYAVFCL